METINKYTAQFKGISKTVYTWNLGQAFQEASIWADKKGLELLTVTDHEESILESECPYFGIYQKFNA